MSWEPKKIVRNTMVPTERNVDCTVVDGYMRVGSLLANSVQDYSTGDEGITVIKLQNNTSSSIQVNQVVNLLGADGPGNFFPWGEYQVFKDKLIYGQIAPGIGEVGCASKDDTETSFVPLQWDGITTALSVPPGSCIYIQGYLAKSKGKDYNCIFRVITEPDISGVTVYRQPQMDQILLGTGGGQNTKWSPWKNMNPYSIVITGASIYADDPIGTSVKSATIYVLNKDDFVRWSFSKGMNRRGTVQFPTNQIIYPGESIAAQAAHTCPVGETWDWAAYIYAYSMKQGDKTN